MSRRLLPPPPLTAPTPSKVRPPEPPLIVIAVAASAGVATTAVPATAKTAAATVAAALRTLRSRVMGMGVLTFGDGQEPPEVSRPPAKQSKISAKEETHWPRRGGTQETAHGNPIFVDGEQSGR